MSSALKVTKGPDKVSRLGRPAPEGLQGFPAGQGLLRKVSKVSRSAPGSIGKGTKVCEVFVDRS